MKKEYYSRWLAIAAIVMTLLVILGAFGAHGLKEKLSSTDLTTYKTGLRYGFIHALALLIGNGIGLAAPLNTRWFNRMIGVGLLLFTCSLMIHATRSLLGLSIDVFAMLAPLGGLSFVVAWILLALQFKKL